MPASFRSRLRRRPASPLRSLRRPGPALLFLSAAIAAAACDGGGTAGPGEPPPPPPPPAVTGITLSRSTLALTGVGSETTLSATLTPSGATGTLAWRTESPAIATVTGSGATATVRAVAGGATRVIASVGSVEASAELTVTPIARSVSVSPATLALTVGGTGTLAAELVADAGVDTALTWTSSDAAIASVSSAGVVTAVAPGTATITVASVAAPAITASATVTVNLPVVTVAIVPDSLALFVGATETVVATVTAAPAVSTDVTWSSREAAVASVSAAGVLTAVAPGTTVITAVSVANPTAMDSVVVTVRQPQVTALAFTLADTIAAGGVDTAAVTITADPGANTALAWSSANSAVATVNAAGVVTAVAAGTTTITVASAATPAVTATRTVTVTAPVFPVRWTATFDGRIGPADVQGAHRASAMLPDGTLLVVGDSGSIVERSPTGTWTRRSSPVTTVLADVLVAGGQAWAWGNGGVVLRRSASGWERETIPTTANVISLAMRADGSGALSTDTSLFVRNANGVWTWMEAPSTNGSTSTPRVAVTEGGGLFALRGTASGSTGPAFYRRVGEGWAGVAKRVSTEAVGQIHVLSDDVLLVGGSENFVGFINRWQNGTWTREYTDPGPQATARSAGIFSRCLDGTVLGGVNWGAGLRRLESGVWTPLIPPGTALPGYSRSACATPDLRFQVAHGGVVRWNGPVLSIELHRQNFTRMGFGGGALAFASSPGATLALRYDGTRWHPVEVPSTQTFNTKEGPAFGVWGSQALALVADQVGTWNGTAFTWQVQAVPSRDLWGATINDVWAVGPGNVPAGWWAAMRRQGGSTWTNVEPGAPSNTNWFAVHGASADAVFTGGHGNAMGHWNGATFTRHLLPAVFDAASDIAAFSATSAIAIGAGRRIFRWNGTAWSYLTPSGLPTAASAAFTTITGRSEDEYYVFVSTGTGGEVYGCTLVQCARLHQFPAVVRKARIVGGRGIGVGDGGLIIYGDLVAGRRR